MTGEGAGAHDDAVRERAPRTGADAGSVTATAHRGARRAPVQWGAGRPPLTALQRSAGNAALAGLLASRWVQRQASGSVPSLTLGRPETFDPALLRSANVRGMTEPELRDRLRLADLALARHGRCPTDRSHPYWTVSEEASRAGTELARRAALAAGRTFSDADVTAARTSFEENAAKPKGGGRKECIVILNSVLKDIWQDPTQRHTNQTIELAMQLFEAGGRAGAPREIWFTRSNGGITRGGARPEGVASSLWHAAVEMTGGDPGWSMFGLSLMDGYHALTLTVDNNDRSAPKVFLSDQVPGWTDGWKEYAAADLEAHVLGMVQDWWDGMAEGRKHTTVIRLWRLRRRAAPAPSGP